ncbi:MAG: YihY/virulence factor BrkB family protein [Polyangiaceae bacterium]|nr:YihY/virulence factor BrkB family protein [Polyangiaceae bacterium]
MHDQTKTQPSRISPPLPAGAPWFAHFARGAIRLVQGLYFHDAFQAAPAMAFHFFLSLLPALAFVGYVAAIILQKTQSAALIASFLENAPPSAQDTIKMEIDRLASASAVGPLGVIGFVWLAAGGLHGLMDALETAVGAPRRSWWKKRVLSLAFVVAGLAFVALVSFTLIEWQSLVHLQRGARVFRIAGHGVLALLVSTSVSALALALFFRFSVSYPARVKRRVLPGALLAVVLWVIISWGFGVYVRSLAKYTIYYGSLAAVAVLLVWLWLTSLSILVGAELNAQLEGMRDRSTS